MKKNVSEITFEKTEENIVSKSLFQANSQDNLQEDLQSKKYGDIYDKLNDDYYELYAHYLKVKGLVKTLSTLVHNIHDEEAENACVLSDVTDDYTERMYAFMSMLQDSIRTVEHANRKSF